MKNYTIIKVEEKEICYRIYGSKTGKGIEVIDSTDFNNCKIVKKFFSWWAFDAKEEAIKLYKTFLK